MRVDVLSTRKPWIWFFGLVVRLKQLRSLGRRIIRKLTGQTRDGFENSAPRLIPKTIWIFWDTGEENAPDVVKMCVASWRLRNPNWTVHVLDRTTLSRFIQMPELSPEITIQAYTNLVRFRLLKEHGGAWVDATSFCVRPLDHWLPVVAQQGFFAFYWTKADRWFTWPGYTREVASWFLASEAGGEIISAWEEYSFDYWDGRRLPHLYFWCQSLYEVLRYLRPSFRRADHSVPKLGCLAPHIVHDCVLRARDPDRVARIIADGAAPVQKLSWKWTEEQIGLAKTLLLGPGADRLSQDEITDRLQA